MIVKQHLRGEKMVDKIVRYTLRTERELFRKFRYVADYEGRSANKEIEQFMKKRVREFEKLHGKIENNDENRA